MNRVRPRLASGAWRAGGFSLVEIMVALVAGLLLTAGIAQVYLGSKKTYNLQEQMSRLQENARYAIDRISHDIRMAGSVGCDSRSINTPRPEHCNPSACGSMRNTLNSPDELFYNFVTRIQGFDALGTLPGETYGITATNPAPTDATGNWAPPVPGEALDAIPGSDILVTRGRADSGVPYLLQRIDPNSLVVVPPPPPDDQNNQLEADDIAMVADCGTSWVFQVTGFDGATIVHDAGGTPGPGNAQPTWTWNGPPPSSLDRPERGTPAEVGKVASTLYYLSRSNGNPNEGPSLYQKIGTSPAQALVEGVESMQVQFGVGTGPLDNLQIQYQSASAVANWQQVISVRIGLLMRTLDEVRSDLDTQVYEVNGTMIDPVDDHRLRQVFTTTIAVRNGIQTQ
jgi:type IV pilus assembly protein PilW